jgi:hypothetical protein
MIAIVGKHPPAWALGDASSWAKARASSHPMTPTSGRMLSRKALVLRVTGLPPEPVPDVDALPSVGSARPAEATPRTKPRVRREMPYVRDPFVAGAR